MSDKKRAEDELRQQRRHLIDAQALAHLGSWRWDIDTGKGEWSDELFRIFGYEPGAIADTYDTFLASLHSDDQALVLAAINAALLGTCPYDVEYRIVRPNGEVRFIHARGDVYRDATGHPLSMAGSALDITERKRIEDALRASEERWQLAVRGSNDGIWDWNVQSGDIFFSPRWKAMRGFEDHEIKNHIDEWRSRIHLDDLDRVLQSLDAYFAKQRPEFCEEYRVQRKDGSYMWILDRGVALWADNGTPLRMAGSETDITARKGAEEALVRNRDLMKSFVEHTPAGVAMLDKGLRYVAVSRRWLEDYRLGHQQLIGRHHYDVFPEIKDMKEWQEIHQRCLSGAVERCEEDHFTRADGSEDWLRWEVRPWHDITGEIGGIIMFTEVLTERKQAYSLLQATINSTADGLLVVNRQGKVTSVNQQFLELWRIPQDLAERREEESLLAFVLEQLQEPEAFLTKVRELYSRPEQESFDMLTFKDGRGFECNSRPQILDENIVGRVWSFHDITARQRTEKALRESEERFALAVEGSTDILWDAHRLLGEPWYAPQTPIWWSPRVRELLGLEESESFETLEQWVVRLHPDDKDHVFGQLAAHIEHRVPYDAEYRLRTNRGDYRWIRGRGEAMWDKQGEVRRMSGSCQDITDRKQVEEALRRSERQLRTVLDALPVGVWFTDQSGKPVLSNPAAKQIWCDIKQVGIEAASNTTGWWEAIGSSSELHRWALSHALTKGIPSLNETLELECLDGTKKTIRNATVPVLDEAGIVLGAIVLNEDITPLRQAQEALKLTQFSVDHAVEGFFWIGPDARILNVNDAACRMLEYTRDELTTMTMYDIDPNLSPVLWSARWEVVKQRGSMTFESKQWSKTGRVLDAEVTVNYLDYEGKDYNCAIVRDIGERKRAEMSLRQSEERYRSLVDNAPIGIFVNDAGRFVYANREMQRILNASSAEQLIGTPVLERIAPEFHSVVKDRIHKLTKGQPVQLIDEKFVRLDGLRVDVAVTAIPTSFDGTTVMQVLVLDITERKRMEETLRQRERDLHVVIEERERISQDLHDGVLQSLFAVGLTLESAKLMMSPRSRKMLGQPIDQAIAQLNCVMHEIRNFIAGLGSDLLKGKDLRMALRHMLKLLRQIQDTRVRLVVEDRATQALSTEQSLHLLLVIQEAVSNCIRHGRAQEATVSLRLLKQGVRLSVRDNGCGFNPKAARRTGHGLTNMAARTQKIGGRLTVMSKVNEGTCIVLDLPKEVSSVCY